MTDTTVRDKPATTARSAPAVGTKPTGPIGARIERKEDARFLTGVGQYTSDVTLPKQTHAYFLRSPHAHARIASISTEAARKSPGVIAVYTGADLPATVGGLPCGWLITGTDGK